MSSYEMIKSRARIMSQLKEKWGIHPLLSCKYYHWYNLVPLKITQHCSIGSVKQDTPCVSPWNYLLEKLLTTCTYYYAVFLDMLSKLMFTPACRKRRSVHFKDEEMKKNKLTTRRETESIFHCNHSLDITSKHSPVAGKWVCFSTQWPFHSSH